MTTKDESHFLTDNLSQILDIIACIARKSAEGSYIYRGESKHFDKVSSNLYRQYDGNHGEHFSIGTIQQEILEGARKYTTQTDEVEILSELQHYGGKTNLIDFTTDYLIVLFFACDGYPLEDGRVILLERTGTIGPHIEELRNLNNRAIVQKSILVIPPKGFVEPDHIIEIPKNLKEPLLEYLRHSHSISTETIYNDLHGFIRQQNLHRNAYRELHLAVTYHKEHDADYQHAIDHYTEAIALNPRLAQAYCGRGGAYLSKADFDRAIQDLSRAAELEKDHSCAYSNRGRVYLIKDNYEQAIQDLSKAIDLNQEFENPTTSAAHFFRGAAYLQKGDAYGQAIRDFNQAIILHPDSSETYCLRGTAYAYNGDYSQGIKDFDQAIELSDEDSCAYHNRGVTRLFLADWECAKTDLRTARDMGIDIGSVFCDDFESVAAFEKRNGVEIPEEISVMLGG